MPQFRHLPSRLALTVVFWIIPALASAQSVEFFVNDAGAGNYDYGDQTMLPPDFGTGEFTLELWVRLNDSFPVGPVTGGTGQRENWAIEDIAPYSNSDWWFSGNFLLDGHNNNNFADGTFSLQFYGGGRLRWLFGDEAASTPTGGLWSVGAYPASTTPTLLDGAWHQVTLVRRWTGQSDSLLELWIDGLLIDSEVSDSRANMQQWWAGWTGFPSNQEGWFWGAEKQAAIGRLSQYEDYKGLIDELRFWSRAKSPGEIAANHANSVVGNEPGLVANFTFGEGLGNSVCDTLLITRCIFLQNSYPGVWSSSNAPLATGGDTQPPSTPANLQGTAASPTQINLNWNASTDNVGVTGYQLRRDGIVIANPSGTSFSDSGLSPNTTYVYTVAARDAAGNFSAESSGVTVTTLVSSDSQPPSTPANLQGTAVSPTQINLNWNASTDNVGVAGYQLRRDGIVVANPGGTSFSDSGLSPNTTYVYTVTARDAAGNVSAESPAVTVTTPTSTDTEAPSVPTGLNANATSSSQVRLTWVASTDNVGVSEYEIFRDGAQIGTSSGTTFNDSRLTANTTYRYTVAALDAAGNRSGESAAATVTTMSNPSTNTKSGGGTFGLITFLVLLGTRLATWRRRAPESSY